MKKNHNKTVRYHSKNLRYTRFLIGGHLLFWSGIASIFNRVTVLDIMSPVPVYPLPLIFSGIFLLWYAHRSDNS